MTPVRDLTLSLQRYFFWRASDRDALYDKTGNVLRPGTGTLPFRVSTTTSDFARPRLLRTIFSLVADGWLRLIRVSPCSI